MPQHPIDKGWGSGPVGTNRKRLGNKAGAGGAKPMPPIAYNDGLCDGPALCVRAEALVVGAGVGGYKGGWLEETEGACRLD